MPLDITWFNHALSDTLQMLTLPLLIVTTSDVVFSDFSTVKTHTTFRFLTGGKPAY